MQWMSELGRRVSMLLRRDEFDRDLDEEMRPQVIGVLYIAGIRPRISKNHRRPDHPVEAIETICPA